MPNTMYFNGKCVFLVLQELHVGFIRVQCLHLHCAISSDWVNLIYNCSIYKMGGTTTQTRGLLYDFHIMWLNIWKPHNHDSRLSFIGEFLVSITWIPGCSQKRGMDPRICMKDETLSSRKITCWKPEESLVKFICNVTRHCIKKHIYKTKSIGG